MITSVFFILLILPFFAVRSFSLKKQGIWAIIAGVSQDLFVVSHVLFLFACLEILLNMKLFWVQMGVFMLLHLNALFDAYLYRKTGMRMEIPFFAFLDDIRCFWDSAKSKGVLSFLPFGAALLAFSFVSFTYFPYAIRPSLLSFCTLIAIGLPGILGSFLLPKRIVYSMDNIAFQQEKWLLKQGYYKLQRLIMREERKALAHGDLFMPDNEVHMKLSPDEYPLLRKTEAFEGESLCNVEIKEEEKPHVIFLFMESFRAKDVGVLGGKQGVTPHFDRLAQEGILFKNFYANSIKTSRAVTASLFGVPSDIDPHDASGDSQLPLISIADVMSREGYETSYLHNGPVHFENQDRFFYAHGYEKVIGKDEMLARYPNAPKSSWGLPDEYLMHYTIEELAKKKTPQFLTMFTITNHHPWSLPPSHHPIELSKELHSTYRNYLRTFHYSDHALGLFIDRLKESGLSKNTILFVMGDHGQAMGEHDKNFTQQKNLYEENIHVPLLIYADGRIPHPKVMEDVSSQIDLLPTVIDMLSIKGTHHSMGHSLLRKVSDRRAFFHNPYVHGFFGMRRGDMKLIYTRDTQEIELYDIRHDPDEKKNLAHLRVELSEMMMSEVKAYEQFFRHAYDKKSFVPERFFHDPKTLLEKLQSGRDKIPT